jgi:ubiquinone/menaquinone biosynthesis C-methylase UbiE
MPTGELSAAARAFDSIAEAFDQKFGPWLSVAAQRRAVRCALDHAFPRASSLIEIGGGTGDDALWLVERGRRVLMTDASPAMVRVASAKFADCPWATAEVDAAEELAGRAILFDGAYSNFAALNCVTDLGGFARSLAKLLRPGAPALLVLFGTHCPGEIIVEALRGRPRNMFRRLARGDVRAALGGQTFTVRYHRQTELTEALAPWFTFGGRQGIGLFVPPSAAEPWISRHPRLLRMFERLDRACSTAMAPFGDHILYRYSRTDVPADAG